MILFPFNFFSKEWIENLDDLIKYRKNHRDEEWEFAENFPEDEKQKIIKEVEYAKEI